MGRLTGATFNESPREARLIMYKDDGVINMVLPTLMFSVYYFIRLSLLNVYYLLYCVDVQENLHICCIKGLSRSIAVQLAGHIVPCCFSVLSLSTCPGMPQLSVLHLVISNLVSNTCL